MESFKKSLTNGRCHERGKREGEGEKEKERRRHDTYVRPCHLKHVRKYELVVLRLVVVVVVSFRFFCRLSQRLSGVSRPVCTLQQTR